MARRKCAFGGQPGAWADLAPLPPPPHGTAFRIVSGRVWWMYMYWPWRKYLAKRALAATSHPPLLGRIPTGGGLPAIWITDRESLRGVQGPGDFAHRVGLSAHDCLDCQTYGCAIIEFEIPARAVVRLPAPYPGVPQGLTVGGAREWLVLGSVELEADMRVWYVDTTASGHRWYELPL